MQADAFVFILELSQIPFALEVRSRVPPVMITSASAFRHFVASEATVTDRLPPLTVIVPVSSSSRSASSLNEVWIPSSPGDEMVTFPLSIRKYWAQLMPSFTDPFMLRVRFLISTYYLA